jgi:hypothetical protein
LAEENIMNKKDRGLREVEKLSTDCSRLIDNGRCRSWAEVNELWAEKIKESGRYRGADRRAAPRHIVQMPVYFAA